MKLFSRKAIAAVATTVALTTAGLNAPAFAETDQVETTPVETTPAEGSSDILSGSSDLFSGSSNSGTDGEEGSSSDPKEIRDWVAVFTTIIGALSAAFVFIQRLTA